MKDVKSKLYKSTFEAGIWDIFIGLYFIISRFINVVFNIQGMSFIFLLIGLLIPYLIRRYVVLPRKGRVKIEKISRRNKNVVIIVFFLIPFLIPFVAVSGFIIGTLVFDYKSMELAIDPAVLEVLLDVVFELAFIAFLIVIAYLTKFTRLYYYALILGSIILVSALFELFLVSIVIIVAWITLALGSCIVLGGLYLLIQFLKQHPLPKEADLPNISEVKNNE